MAYMLGTDTEKIGFEGARIRYTPHGQRHAVDLDDGFGNSRGAVLGYALCGRAVRAWPGQHFDADAPGAHPACVARAPAPSPSREAAPAGTRRAR